MRHVQPDASEHALVGIHQLGLDDVESQLDVQDRSIQMLCRALNIGRVIAFVGSGLTRAYKQPSWKDFTKDVVKYTIDNASKLMMPEEKTLLESHHSGTHQTHRLSPNDQYLILLGICDEIFQRGNGEKLHDRFREHLMSDKKIIRDASENFIWDGHDPLRFVIKKLGISRFLTTNWDLEIEAAFVRTLSCSPESLKVGSQRHSDFVGPEARSFSIGRTDPESLVQFALRAPGYESGVFHVHGTARDKYMVMTERDYQQAYLRDEQNSKMFREALNLCFRSNAVLFLGLGMSEGDLLRPLREFVSETHREAKERPLFALLQGRPGSDAEAFEFGRFLHTRYGVKSIFYDQHEGEEREVAFERAINNLSQRWRGWWTAWQRKPALQRTVLRKRRGGLIFQYVEHPLGSFNVDNLPDVQKLLDDTGSGPILLYGGSGTGKGSLGKQLFDASLPQYQRCFLATFKYTSDFLHVVAAASQYLNSSLNQDQDPISSLGKALQQRNLAIFTGVERLLEPLPPTIKEKLGVNRGRAHRPAVVRVSGASKAAEELRDLSQGRPLTDDIDRFFRLLLESNSWKGHLVLVSASVIHHAVIEDVQRLQLRPVALDKLTTSEIYKRIDCRTLATLHANLKGHAYCLSLVENIIREFTPQESEKKLYEVNAALSASSLPRRFELVAKLAFQSCLDRAGPDMKETLQRVLQRFVLTHTPLSISAVATCAGIELASAEKAVSELQHANLLLPISTYESYDRKGVLDRGLPAHNVLYTPHTLVRKLELHVLGSLPDIPEDPQTLFIGTYSDDVPGCPVLSQQAHSLCTTTFDRLVARAYKERRGTTAAEFIRAAFGIARSQWSVSTMERLSDHKVDYSLGLRRPHLDAYHRRLAQLLNIARKFQSSDLWLSEEENSSDHWNRNALFSLHQLAWLYNELGLVAYAQGSLHDAYALFRATEDIDLVGDRRRSLPGVESVGSRRWLRSSLQLALVQLERGRLSRAGYHLGEILRTSRLPQSVRGLALGYEGLLHHLSGNYDIAEKRYSKAIAVLLKEANNFRALSIFYRHRGDLRRRQGNEADARMDQLQSIAAAETGRHPALLHFSRVAMANLERSPDARVIIQQSLRYSLAIGLPKLEADTLKVEGEIALSEGETERAGQLAINCLGLACAGGMRLRVTAALILLGKVSAKRNDLRSAESLFRSAIDFGQRQGYQLQIEEAEQQLIKLGAVGATGLRP